MGCRRDATTGEYVTPSDTTFQRVMERTDPASLERALERWTQPRGISPSASPLLQIPAQTACLIPGLF